MLTIEYVSPSELSPAGYNPRSMTAEQRKRLSRSVREFGMVDPIIARRADKLVVGGHQRLTAALELGLAEVPVVYLDDLDDNRAAALNVALNNPTAQGSWDIPKLTDLLARFEADGFDATLTGFDHDELAAFLFVEPALAEDTADLTPPKAPKSVRGEVYELGRHRLMCGDSTDATAMDTLTDGARAAIVWTDPPYNVDYVGKTADALTIENDTTAEAAIDGVRLAVGAYLEDGGPIYICFPAEQPAALAAMWAGFHLQSMIVWAKDTMVMGRKDYHYQHEPLWYGWREGAAHKWYGGRTLTTLWTIARPSRSEEHPTTKPVELVTRALEAPSRVGGGVLDPFGGSGTTLIAAAASGRTAHLMELDPRYCDVIRRRYAVVANRPDLDPDAAQPKSAPKMPARAKAKPKPKKRKQVARGRA